MSRCVGVRPTPHDVVPKLLAMLPPPAVVTLINRYDKLLGLSEQIYHAGSDRFHESVPLLLVRTNDVCADNRVSFAAMSIG